MSFLFIYECNLRSQLLYEVPGHLVFVSTVMIARILLTVLFCLWLVSECAPVYFHYLVAVPTHLCIFLYLYRYTPTPVIIPMGD